jgi:hypothetical protein
MIGPPPDRPALGWNPSKYKRLCPDTTQSGATTVRRPHLTLTVRPPAVAGARKEMVARRAATVRVRTRCRDRRTTRAHPRRFPSTRTVTARPAGTMLGLTRSRNVVTSRAEPWDVPRAAAAPQVARRSASTTSAMDALHPMKRLLVVTAPMNAWQSSWHWFVCADKRAAYIGVPPLMLLSAHDFISVVV